MIGCKCKYHSVGGAYGSNPRPYTATIYFGNQRNGQLYIHDMLCVYKFNETKYQNDEIPEFLDESKEPIIIFKCNQLGLNVADLDVMLEISKHVNSDNNLCFALN